MNRIEMPMDAIDKNRSKDAQRPIEPVVSVTMTEATADALHKLLSRVSIDEMQRRGLNYNESLLVSRIKPALY